MDSWKTYIKIYTTLYSETSTTMLIVCECISRYPYIDFSDWLYVLCRVHNHSDINNEKRQRKHWKDMSKLHFVKQTWNTICNMSPIWMFTQYMLVFMLWFFITNCILYNLWFCMVTMFVRCRYIMHRSRAKYLHSLLIDMFSIFCLQISYMTSFLHHIRLLVVAITCSKLHMIFCTEITCVWPHKQLWFVRHSYFVLLQ